MAKRIRTPPNSIPPDENFSRDLIQLQSYVKELEDARFAILEEEDKINMLILAVYDMIASGSDSSTSLQGLTIPGEQITDPIQPLPDTLKILEDTIREYHGHFQQIIQTLNQPLPEILFSVLHDNAQDGISVQKDIRKIPLFLIHGDLYTLIRLIHHYSHYDYFSIYPHATLASALEQIFPKTDGLILIASALVRENSSRIISTIREQNVSMPVIVMEDCDPVIEQLAGLNGFVPEECPLSELLNAFLTGLQTQISYQAPEPQEYHERE